MSLLAKWRKCRELLGDRDLKVMSGKSFVVGSRFDRDEFARLRIRGVHHDVPRPRAVRCALIVGGGRVLLLPESLHGENLESRLRQPPEELRKSRLHLRNVVPVQLEKLFTRFGVKLGILLDRRVDRFEIVEAKLPGDL